MTLVEIVKQETQRLVFSKVCKEEVNVSLDIFDRKSLQMQIAWAAAKKAKKEGMHVLKLPVSEAWKAVTDMTEKIEKGEAVCPLPQASSEHGEQKVLQAVEVKNL